MPKKAKFSKEDEKKIINFVKLNKILYLRNRNTEAKNHLWLQLANELSMDVEVVKKKWQTMRDYFVRSQKKKTIGSSASPLSKWDKSLAFLLQTSIYASACLDSYHRQISCQSFRVPNDDIHQFFNSMASTVRKFSPKSIAGIKTKIARIVGEEEISFAKKTMEFRRECRRVQTLLRKSFVQKDMLTQKRSRHKQPSDNSIENYFTDKNAEPKTSTPKTDTAFNDPEFSDLAIDETMIPMEVNENSDEDDNKSFETFDTRLTRSDPSDDVDWSSEYNEENIKPAKRTKKSLNAEEISKVSTQSPKVSNKTVHRKGEKISYETIPDINLSNDHKRAKYICEMCGQTYNVRRYFQTHINRHKGNQTFACEICPEKYYSQKSLKRHLLKHGGLQPVACRYCPRRFLDCSSKVRHERMHTNDRPFKCTYCGQAFTSSCTLKGHILTHTGERKFSCEICQRSFTLKKQLATHYKSITHKQNEEKQMRFAN